jgi:hypothetical protein
VERESSEYIVADDTVASESQLDRPPRMPSSFSLDTKSKSFLLLYLYLIYSLESFISKNL